MKVEERCVHGSVVERKQHYLPSYSRSSDSLDQAGVYVHS